MDGEKLGNWLVVSLYNGVACARPCQDPVYLRCEYYVRIVYPSNNVIRGIFGRGRFT